MSVVAGRDRVDLVVPAAVSVAELLADLASRLGTGDPQAAARLSVLGGPALDTGSGLGEQGVADGALLVLSGAEEAARPVQDDLTLAVADVVEAMPRTATGTVADAVRAVAAALAGAAALGIVAEGSVESATAAGVAAAMLVVVAFSTVRRGPSPPAHVTGWLAVALAAAAGARAGLAGAGAAVVAAGALLGVLTVGRVAAVAAAVPTGLVLVATGSVAHLAALPLPVVATGALVLVVVSGDAQPWLAASLAGLTASPVGEQPTTPDPATVADDVRRAHGLLVLATVATGLTLGMLAPVVAGSGGWGLVVALLGCLVVGLRSRRQRVGPAGLLGLLGSLVPLLPIGVVTWCRWPDHSLDVLVAALAVAVLLLVVVVLPRPRSPRLGRLAEIAEALALVALPPAALAATGLLDVVRDLVP